MSDASTSSKERVAIIGGGVGAMTAAFEMTSPLNPKADQLEVTVYQMGWRLGGKGASGRNMTPDGHYRIEEHGLHVWMGGYDNSFRMIQQCYEELDRAPDAPLAAWDDAFKPLKYVVLQEEVQNTWQHWGGFIPTNDDKPGTGTYLSLGGCLSMALGMLRDRYKRVKWKEPVGGENVSSKTVSLLLKHGKYQKFGADMVGQLLSAAADIAELHHKNPKAAGALAAHYQGHGRGGQGFLNALPQAVGGIMHAVLARGEKTVHSLLGLVGGWPERIVEDLLLEIMRLALELYWNRIKDRIDSDTAARHDWIAVNLGYGTVHGIVEDRLVERGLDSVNDQEFREWLGRHAYPDNDTLLGSTFIRSVYDAIFGYIDGDMTIPPGASYAPKANVEAGSCLRGGMRIALMARGAAIYEMQAGMGDTVFSPIYEVLKKRGVKFKFFHKVEQLHASADGSQIDRIEMAQQVTIKSENGEGASDEYNPLVEVKGLPCWPSTPLYDQIVEGALLKEGKINLEAPCPDWKNAGSKTLELGKDFDKVVLGVSLASIPYLCCDLVKASSKWKDMVDNVKTVRTQALQLWLRPTVSQLGWPFMREPITTGFDYQTKDGDPLDTWADMSHLLNREGWPARNYPQNIAYFCSPMRDPKPLPITPCGPKVDCEEMNPETEDKKVRKEAVNLLNNEIQAVWPNAVQPAEGPGTTPAFKWEMLWTPQEPTPTGESQSRDESNLDYQYWRANVAPSERYVLTTVGTTKYRLPPNDPTEFTNLYLAGDWTLNGFNTGCVESAAMGGMLASSELCGYPKRSDIVCIDFGKGTDHGE